MLRSLWLVMIYTAFLGLGTQAPWVLTLGYLWVDTFRPQEVTYFLLNQIPVALIMGAAAFLSYFAVDRRDPPALNIITVCHILLAIWVTVTMNWIVAPYDFANEKWDWAFKTLAFASFVPFVIRSRVQIDAFMQVYVLSLAANILPYGAKIILSGGGYGQELGISGGNSGLGEGATLSAVAVMTVPLALFLRKHSQLIPASKIFRLGYVGIAIMCLITTVGTVQRTGLIGLLVLGAFMVFKSRNKLAAALLVLIVGGFIGYLASDAWNARINTIGSYQQDVSAMTRILVWKWTLGYVMEHPFGGGFNMFIINHIEHPPDEANPGGSVEFGRAFHSIYFEVLGEHGWPGLALFLCMLFAAHVMLTKAARRVRGVPEHLWLHDLAGALQVGLAVLMACGAFIGIAFQPMIHYMLAMAVSVSAYSIRVTSGAALADVGKNFIPAWRQPRLPGLTPGRPAPVSLPGLPGPGRNGGPAPR